jgi:hypothetical protein
MEDILLFLRAYELWIYILLGGAAVLVFNRLASARKEVRSALYGLEREKAQSKFNGRLAILVILGLIGMTEFALVTFVQPQVNTQAYLPTATIDLQKSSEMIPIETVTPEELLSPVITMTPTVGIVPVAEGCIPGALEWINPTDGSAVSGTIDFRFNVQVQNLGFYKYEYAVQGTEQWLTIAAGNELITDESSGGTWVTETLIPGDYRLRLVAINSNNETIGICAISVRVLMTEQ